MKNKLVSILHYIKNNKYTNYIIIVAISLLVSIPFFNITLIDTGDTYIHLLRIIGLKNSIEDGAFPYIVAPYFCNNFGYATNLFYPQLVTYLPYLLKIFTSSYEHAMYLLASTTIILSGIFMYNFAKQVSKNKWVALIASIIYLIFPYRFECIYERFAIGEFTAMVFIPILFEGLYNLLKQDKSKHYLIAIGAIGIILSHLLTAIYATLFCIIFIIFNLKSFLKKDIIKLCIVNAIFIILSTALFVVPMLEHKSKCNYKIFNYDTMLATGADVYDNSASLKQLITDNGSNKTVSFTIGIPIIIFCIIGIFTYKKIEKENKEWYIQLSLLSMISLFMVTKLFPWLVMPKFLTIIQFSWRLLVFFNFFVAIVCAENIYILITKNENKKISSIFAISLIIITIAFSAIRLQQFVEEKSINKEKFAGYEKMLLQKSVSTCMEINREYLPKKANNNYILKRRDKVYILDGQASIKNENKKQLKMSFEINDYTKNTILELPYLYYQGYKITMGNDSQEKNLNYFESANGFIAISIPDNISYAKIKIEYTGSNIEKTSYAVSAIGILSLIIYMIWYKKINNHKLKDGR